MNKLNFSFDLPVKASRIKKPRRYSDVTITRGDVKICVAAGRPKSFNDWEPNEVVKKVARVVK